MIYNKTKIIDFENYQLAIIDETEITPLELEAFYENDDVVIQDGKVYVIRCKNYE